MQNDRVQSDRNVPNAPNTEADFELARNLRWMAGVLIDTTDALQADGATGPHSLTHRINQIAKTLMVEADELEARHWDSVPYLKNLRERLAARLALAQQKLARPERSTSSE